LLRCLPSLSVAAQETRRTSNDAVLEHPPMADPSLAVEEPLQGHELFGDLVRGVGVELRFLLHADLHVFFSLSWWRVRLKRLRFQNKHRCRVPNK